MKETYRDICERLGWSVSCDEQGNVMLEKYSPAGEDFIVTVGEKGFAEHVNAYAAHFNPEEHIEMWLAARRNGTSDVPSACELEQDAQAIDDMLQELAGALLETETFAKGADYDAKYESSVSSARR